jgi:hypothetical protein
VRQVVSPRLSAHTRVCRATGAGVVTPHTQPQPNPKSSNLSCSRLADVSRELTLSGTRVGCCSVGGEHREEGDETMYGRGDLFGSAEPSYPRVCRANRHFYSCLMCCTYITTIVWHGHELPNVYHIVTIFRLQSFALPRSRFLICPPQPKQPRAVLPHLDCPIFTPRSV